MTRRRVAIVGAGPGGLAAAMLLARAGLEVALFERHPFVGGRTSTHGGNGFRFDLGPTFFLYPRVLASIYEACGLDLAAAVPMKRLDPNYRLIFADGLAVEPTCDPERNVREVARISPADAAGLLPFLAESRRKLAAMRPILESPFAGLSDVLRLPLLSLLPVIRPWASVDQDLRRHFQDPRTRLMFSFQSKYLGMSPFRCPSLFTILSFLEYEFGVWHPGGGCGAVSQAMAGAAGRLGAELRLGEPVRRILIREGRAAGVETDRGAWPADAVVVNGDFARTIPALIPEAHRRRWRDRTIAAKRFSCSTFMLFLGLEGRCDRLAHHNIVLSRDYRRNLAEIEDLHVLPADPSFYVQNATLTDPGLAPPGMTALYVLVPVTHRHANVEWAREAAGFRRLVLGRLEELGIPGLQGRIRHERMITPADWEEEMGLYKGATFNLAHNLGQMLHRRPPNRFADLPGTYLVGGGTHPGSGLPVIYESARISARLLLEDLGLAAGWIRAATGEAGAAALAASG